MYRWELFLQYLLSQYLLDFDNLQVDIYSINIPARTLIQLDSVIPPVSTPHLYWDTPFTATMAAISTFQQMLWLQFTNLDAKLTSAVFFILFLVFGGFYIFPLCHLVILTDLDGDCAFTNVRPEKWRWLDF